MIWRSRHCISFMDWKTSRKIKSRFFFFLFFWTLSAKIWVNHLPHMIIHMSSFLFHFTLFSLFIDILSPNNSVIEFWHQACLFDNNGVCSFFRVIQQTVLFISKSVVRLTNTWTKHDLVILGWINDIEFLSHKAQVCTLDRGSSHSTEEAWFGQWDFTHHLLCHVRIVAANQCLSSCLKFALVQTACVSLPLHSLQISHFILLVWI